MNYSEIERIAYLKGYRVTEEGVVNGIKKTNIGHFSKSGYCVVTIRVHGKSKNLRAHRLQAYQKYGDKIYEPGTVVRHLDGNPVNNHVNNIGIGTHSDNMMDIPKALRLAKAKHATSFVKKHDHAEVIKFYYNTRSYKQTMDKFNISSKGTLNFIIKQSTNGRNKIINNVTTVA